MFSGDLIFYAMLGAILTPYLLGLLAGVPFIGKLTHLFWFTCSIYLVVAGLSMVAGWEDFLKQENFETLAEGARGKKAIGVGMAMVWPYILIALGGYQGYSSVKFYFDNISSSKDTAHSSGDKIEEEKPSKESESKPTPRGLPTPQEFRELMKGVDLWEMDKPPEVVAEGRKKRRPWLKPPDPSQDPPWENPKKRMFWFIIKFWHDFRWGK